MAGIARSLARSGSEPDYVEVERTGGGMSRKHLRAYLGTIPAYGQDESVKGVRLQGAVKGGPAEQAGIVNGDVLIGLGAGAMMGRRRGSSRSGWSRSSSRSTGGVIPGPSTRRSRSRRSSSSSRSRGTGRRVRGGGKRRR